MPRKEAPELTESFRTDVHGIVPGSTVDMDVYESGSEDCIRKIKPLCVCRNSNRFLGAAGNDFPVFDQHRTILDRLKRSEQRAGGDECAHEISSRRRFYCETGHQSVIMKRLVHCH